MTVSAGLAVINTCAKLSDPVVMHTPSCVVRLVQRAWLQTAML